jgi:hypothetical protein
LSIRFVMARRLDFIQTEGRGGLVEGLGLPLYIAYLVLPISFAIMTIRFGARGLFALGGELPVAPTIEGLDQLEKYAGEAPAPSEVPTEVGSVSEDLPEPQSRVQTDPHAASKGRNSPSSDEDAVPTSGDADSESNEVEQ